MLNENIKVTDYVKTVYLSGEEENKFLNRILTDCLPVNEDIIRLFKDALNMEDVYVVILDYPKRDTLYILEDCKKKVYTI